MATTEGTRYFNRELSWMAFNRRVLNLCSNKAFPVLERMRFLAIVSSNLDEFYEVRVAGLLQQLESNQFTEVSLGSMGTREQLSRIKTLTLAMIADKSKVWNSSILPELKKNNVHFKEPVRCTPSEKAWLKNYFMENVYPTLTPLSIDHAHPFPYIGNKRSYVLVELLQEDGNNKRQTYPAIIPIPPILARAIKIESSSKDGKENYVFLSELIRYYASELFSGYKVRSAYIFRLTRNSDLYIDEEETENLLKTIERELHNRKQGAAVRLEVEQHIKPAQLEMLIDEISIPRDFVFKIDYHPVNMQSFFEAYSVVDKAELKFKPFSPYLPTEFKDSSNIFNVISQKDRLLHHPYESFKPVEDFVGQASIDENVLAIKMTLYRVNGGSPIISALKRAAESGKQVTVLVELKARFDEEKNIEWARQLEEAGVHVVYGLVGLKTHSKICMVVRKEESGIKRYVHLGTGNYNSNTAKIYTDLSLFTANDDICSEVAYVFNTLTGKNAEPKFNKLWVAPFSFQSRVIEMIDREIAHAKAGKNARIIIKINSILEQDVIEALYRASQAGVKIDMIVRGICSLIPAMKNMSENITVKSIVGVYLEHSRIYYFENGGDYQLFAGSGDLMNRNLLRRIEVIFPIEDPDIKTRIVEEMLNSFLKDNEFSDLLHPNGTYYKDLDMKKQKKFSSQKYFVDLSEKNSEISKPKKHPLKRPIIVHKTKPE